MSLLDIGGKCYTCSLVDFLPFTCPHCAHVFCKDHVHGHGCADASTDDAGPSRTLLPARIKGECARKGCTSETIESVGGLEAGVEGGAGIAREVRCAGCGEAYCIKHRAQDSHDCTAPRDYNVRSDAGLERQKHAQEVLARTMPSATGKRRLAMPEQIDRTRVAPAPDPERLPPSVIAERAAAAAAVSSSAAAASPPPRPPVTAQATTAATIPSSSSVPAPTPADEKHHKLHCVKLRSLAKPLDPKVPRDTSRAVEWTVDETGDKVRAWLGGVGKYAPTTTAAALGTRKAERIWVPDVMPGGKLFDTLVPQSKLARDGISILCISQKPGPRTAVVLDLATSAGEQMNMGDVLVLVRGWP